MYSLCIDCVVTISNCAIIYFYIQLNRNVDIKGHSSKNDMNQVYYI